MKERILLLGVMPERALGRLARGGIAVEKVERLSKDRTRFLVDAKDAERVLALYPEHAPLAAYAAKSEGKVGLGRVKERLRSRVGVLLGGLVFLAGTAFADTLVLKIEVKTDTPLKTEISRLLDENGVRLFSPYDEKNADLLAARILALEGVGHCTVKKVGSVFSVEAYAAPFIKETQREKRLVADRSGTLLSLVVLRGEGYFKAGDAVEAGFVLAGGGESGYAAARACLSCTYENSFSGISGEEAFAKCLLAIGYGKEQVKILKKQIDTEEDTVFLKVEYEYVFSVNF
ncbi:MAG: sporulation protein YqfD [Clostridia bacterium]|nr:sporulation protein YqfD [Clostridia bacterium]